MFAPLLEQISLELEALNIPYLVHHAHIAAAPELLEDAIVQNGCADHVSCSVRCGGFVLQVAEATGSSTILRPKWKSRKVKIRTLRYLYGGGPTRRTNASYLGSERRVSNAGYCLR